MESVRGYTINQPFNRIHHNDGGLTAVQFADWPRVEMSDQGEYHYQPGRIDQKDVHGQPKLNQRGCTECQQQPVLSLPESSSDILALKNALKSDDMQALKRLCEAGADVNAAGLFGMKPMHMAVKFNIRTKDRLISNCLSFW